MNLKELRVAFGCDHGGFALKESLVGFLRRGGAEVEDLGCHSAEKSVDYPDYASEVARSVASGKAGLGILCCGTGIGMSIAANKVRGVRAAVVWNTVSAALAHEHNNANVLCLGGRHFKPEEAVEALKAFLQTQASMETRHQNRIEKIKKLEGC